MSKSYSAWQDYEWLMEEGADEKLQREVEEELRLAELERLMMQEEQASGDLQMMDQMTNLSMRTSQPPVKSRLNVNAPVFVPSWVQKA
ncbi:Oidioi.mRNA.OKI2018_I69.chr1.g3247.t1.cds [Oikopleura dioica]|uniref:Oidioi.mRNA.OKI2018_I69.chr1.g3247.t1.cds n=1 Tax=Oikopleura dioica TaxID=34765 RepID=A0ABN7SXS7_OIKDI|nr:Oidioi.mRNA.OKI2018_I69.chr1.g3247.t1.cds [Oikopleura dioica]